MVAKINIPKDLTRALRYNEQKVQKGQAQCIAAGNYLRAANQLTYEQKLRRFGFYLSIYLLLGKT